MDAAIQQMVDRTGLVVPLAARIINLLAESGASKMEMGLALELADKLRLIIPAALLPDQTEAATASSAGLA